MLTKHGYDETFRKLGESSTLPWEHPVNVLRLKAAAMGSKVQYKQYIQFNGKKKRFRPQRVCFAYNRRSNVMHSPVNMLIFVKNVTTGNQNQNAHLETEQRLLNTAPLPTPVRSFTPSK